MPRASCSIARLSSRTSPHFTFLSWSFIGHDSSCISTYCIPFVASFRFHFKYISSSLYHTCTWYRLLYINYCFDNCTSLLLDLRVHNLNVHHSHCTLPRMYITFERARVSRSFDASRSGDACRRFFTTTLTTNMSLGAPPSALG
jgi:hypothetical protein